MKNSAFTSLKSIINLNSILPVFIFLILSGTAKSNWLPEKTKSTPNTSNTSHSNSDSLPEGVTQDWLSSLIDENGNRIISESNIGNASREISEDPEGDALQRSIFNGQGTGNQFGTSVSSAGDVNGDGYSDIIVGANGYATNTGRVYIFFGGLSMNTVPNLTLTGAGVNNHFGISVSTAGDVNGDGYSDVIIGAYGYSSNTGRAYIYFGGALMNNTADVIMTGSVTSNYFGNSVSTAGDVNGDGYSDVIVGAFGYSSSAGRAYVYYGGAVMNNAADVTITGAASGYLFGISVSSAGDVNSDGYSDVIVGAYGYSSSTGRAYIYFGGAVMNNVEDVVMTGAATNNYFGNSVSSADDINGDGYSDVIVGAWGYSSNTGRAYVFFGGASMDNTSDVIYTGSSSNSYFGYSVSSAGDINGDGYSDVLAGAYGILTSTGRASVFFGGTSPDNIAAVTITGEAVNSTFGFSVSSAGDINGDGYSDILAGASGYSSNTGRVYLYDYFMKNNVTHDLAMSGEANFNYMGTSVSSAGDVNGDGYSDVIVGARGFSSDIGKAYIFFGGTTMDNTADVTMTGAAASNYFGISVSSAGDVNGDGYSDVIVGAYGYNTNTGRSYIYFGGFSMNNTADVVMTGAATNNDFGISVSSAGDVNGDGYSDVIVGANGNSLNTGRAYIYYGGSTMDNTADVTMTGDSANINFGISVSSAGDVNRDGFSDVIVGAYTYTLQTGKAYIYFGGAVMNSIADVTFKGETTGNLFGYSVSSAGDVNSDGYSDVIVGAFANSSYSGRAYIFFGGSFVDNIADVILIGYADSQFGVSVSSAGDVNGDGYSDVIVGAQYFSGRGGSFVFYGGGSMDNISDMTMTGEAENNRLGLSVSSAGDVNGDGYSDLIVGADNNTTFTGKSYIYMGSAISAKPILNYVKDVPNDQGGYVNLKWTRSSFDVNGNDMITDYIVERSFPPTGGNFAWVNIATIPAVKNSFYSYLASTPFDSTANNSGNFFFRITARTSIASQYWRSAILSGRSIDNIAPLMVSPFNAAAVGPNVLLNWNRSTAPDLLNYVLFRNVNPTIDPYSETPWMTATDSTLLDTSPLNGQYYYFIVAQDIHGNYSPVAVTQRPLTILNLTMFIEGFYNAGSNTQVSDTVTVELRNSFSPYNVVDEAKAIVAPDGLAQLVFGNAESGNYYVAVTHRNSIMTWSASPVTITSGGSVSYNFSTASTQAFGNNMKQVDLSPTRFAVYSGDQNQNGIVDLTDVVNVSNAASIFTNGYVSADMNGDNITDLSDIVITSNNASAFVSVIVP